MKIRQGFVSNSSSSSFIVVFNREELTPEYLKEVLYGNADNISYEYNWGDDNTMFSTLDLCNSIAGELEPISKDNMEEGLVEAMSNLSSYEDSRLPEWPSYIKDQTPEQRMEEYNKYEEECNKVRRVVAKEFMKSLGEADYVFTGEFADDCQMGSQIEHGGTFNNVTHKRISNH